MKQNTSIVLSGSREFIDRTNASLKMFLHKQRHPRKKARFIGRKPRNKSKKTIKKETVLAQQFMKSWIPEGKGNGLSLLGEMKRALNKYTPQWCH